MAVGIFMKKISTLYLFSVLKISILGVLHCETTSTYCFQVSILDFHYPNKPQKLTGVSATTHFIQIDLTPKQARLEWIFFY